MTSREGVPALSIGSIEGGYSEWMRVWRDAITRITLRVAEASEGVESPLNVNVIFQVPGSILTPEFDGVRTGHFSKKDAWLIVQSALPKQPPKDPGADLVRRLTDAVAAAEQWARRRGIADELSGLHQIVNSL